MALDLPHTVSEPLTPESRSFSPSAPDESRTLKTATLITPAADTQPKGPTVVSNEWQVWGSRSGSPQSGMPGFSQPCLGLTGSKPGGITLPVEGEWVAETNEPAGTAAQSQQRREPLYPQDPISGGQPQGVVNNWAHYHGSQFIAVQGEPPVPAHFSPHSDILCPPVPYPMSRVLQHSPPQGVVFPVAFHPSPLAPHGHAPFESLSTMPPHGSSVRRFFFPVPPPDDDRSFHLGPPPRLPPMFRPGPLPPPPPHFHPNSPPFNAYSSPEYGNYYTAQPPEPFPDYSFRFDVFRPPHGPPTYPIPHPNILPNPNFYSQQHSPPLPNVAEVGRPITGPVLVDYPPPPPHIRPPPPAQIISPVRIVPPNIIPTAARPLGFERGISTSSSNERAVPVSISSSNFNSLPRGSQFVQPPGNSSQVLLPSRQARRPNMLPVTERSALLENFRSNRDKAWRLKDILGHVDEFSRDQFGSRFIQQNLESATDEEKLQIFDEIVPSNVNRLMTDVFGNYVIQKFFEFGSQRQRDILADIVHEQLIRLSLHIYGCRVVQKAIDHISEAQQTSVIRRLEQDIFSCLRDAHGNHVIQKLIEVIPPDRLTFLPLISENILTLSTHPYGCRVLQRCLEHLPGTHSKALLQAIHACTLDLMRDQYGNYVIQFIIEQGREQDKLAVISRIRGNLVQLSRHKYASNVCEKALICTDPETRRSLINEIMAPSSPNSEDPILTMAKDQYGNYVLQRALILAEGQQREEFYAQVRPIISALKEATTSYSRPLTSIERLLDRFNGKQISLPQTASLEKSNRHGRSSC